MVVGILGLVLSVLWLFAWSSRGHAPPADRAVERDPYYDGPTRRY